jgi:hypothetical protein
MFTDDALIMVARCDTLAIAIAAPPDTQAEIMPSTLDCCALMCFERRLVAPFT